MSKLSQQEERNDLLHKGLVEIPRIQSKDLANELNIKSSRTSEIILKSKNFIKRRHVQHCKKSYKD